MQSTKLAKLRALGTSEEDRKPIPISKAFFEKQEKKRLAAKSERATKKQKTELKQMKLLKFLTTGNTE